MYKYIWYTVFVAIVSAVVYVSSGRPGSYDAQHRNPLYCHADADCTWELLCLTRHYHPSVALFAHTLLKACHDKYHLYF